MAFIYGSEQTHPPSAAPTGSPPRLRKVPYGNLSLHEELQDKNIAPKDLRQLARDGTSLKNLRTTAGLCKGFAQTNVNIIHKEYATEFHAFCEANPVVMPLLYVSQLGEVAAPPLAANSDIRYDIPKYRRFDNGSKITNLGDLSELGGRKFQDFATFYVGCTFTIDSALKRANVKLPHCTDDRIVSIYRTNRNCHSVGRFHSNIMVSMRAIPEQQLALVLQVCALLPEHHGEPIHIGDPKELGITSLDYPDWGDPTIFPEDSVPVFWACGATAIEVIRRAEMPVAYTHCTGSMFVTDLPVSVDVSCSQLNTPIAIRISSAPLRVDLISKACLSVIHNIDAFIQFDSIFSKSIHCHTEGELLMTALQLSYSERVLLIVGNPSQGPTAEVAETTDGPPGAIAIAAILQALGKTVFFLVDNKSSKTYAALINRCIKLGHLKESIHVEVYAQSSENYSGSLAQKFMSGDTSNLALGDVTSKRNSISECISPITPPNCEGKTAGNSNRFDHIIAVGRLGRSRDGRYYRRDGSEVSVVPDPLEDILVVATELGIPTTGVCCYGNQVGMGKVANAVAEYMMPGSTAGCVTPCSNLVVAGCANWGGYGLAAALYALAVCPVHDRYTRKGVGTPTHGARAAQLGGLLEQGDGGVLGVCEGLGMRDEIRPQNSGCVAGLYFHQEHITVIRKINTVLSDMFK